MNFSLTVKEELVAGAPRALCCRRAYARGLFLGAGATPGGKIVLRLSSVAAKEECARVYHELYHGTPLLDGNRLFFSSTQLFLDLTMGDPVFSCPSCAANFLRGAMISCGSVTDPAKAYLLEFRLPDADAVPVLSAALSAFGWQARMRTVRGESVLYFKQNAVIEDILASIGAQNAMFAFMNAKIERELRNDANRSANCETYNIVRAVGASGKVCDAVKKIVGAARFDALPEELRVTANLRTEHPDASLSELASLHTPPITKSGLNHRLKKILEFSETLPERSSHG